MESLEQSKEEPNVIGNFPKENVDSGESSQSKTISKEVLSEESASLLEKEKNAKSDKNDNCPGANNESSQLEETKEQNAANNEEFEGKSLRSKRLFSNTGTNISILCRQMICFFSCLSSSSFIYSNKEKLLHCSWF